MVATVVATVGDPMRAGKMLNAGGKMIARHSTILVALCLVLAAEGLVASVTDVYLKS